MLTKKIPVILDTDIGSDIDDSWALALLLRSPELDLKFITTCNGDTPYRARIAERMLEAAGRNDIPIFTGKRESRPEGYYTLENLAEKQDRSRADNAAEQIVSFIMNAAGPVTVIAIGPLINLADALLLEPAIAPKTDLVGMLGSIEKTVDGAPGKIAEYNIIEQCAAAQKVFAEKNWHSFTITPLDTCGTIRLPIGILDELKKSSDPLMRELAQQNLTWFRNTGKNVDELQTTSILFDTLAVTLAFDHSFFAMRPMHLKVDDDAFLIEDERAPEINVALDWLDQEAYRKFLIRRLLNR